MQAAPVPGDTLYINGIPSSAPMFNKMTDDRLREIRKALSRASYHYADDSTAEWAKARQEIASAAKMIREGGLRYDAIAALYNDRPQLFDIGEIINAIFKSYQEEKA
jgi:hypothetical protein